MWKCQKDAMEKEASKWLNYPEYKLTLTKLLKNSIEAFWEFRPFKPNVWASS